MLIINSDDFGLSPEVNRAIYEAYQANLISSTTTLVNFDDGFQDAKGYIGEDKIPPSSIGIHFNLTEGKPLSEKILEIPRFCKDGVFVTKRAKPMFSLTKDEKEAVYTELQTQFEHFAKGFGFNPSHIDSHHHIHTEWAILNIVLKIAKQNKVSAVRIARNTGKANSFVKSIYRKMINLQVRFQGIETVDYFGDIDDFNLFGIRQDKSQEIMVHALYNKKILVDMDRMNLKEKVNDLLNTKNPELSNYTDLLTLRKPH